MIFRLRFRNRSTQQWEFYFWPKGRLMDFEIKERRELFLREGWTIWRETEHSITFRRLVRLKT